MYLISLLITHGVMNEMHTRHCVVLSVSFDVLCLSIHYLIDSNRYFFLPSLVARCAMLLSSRDPMFNLITHRVMNEMHTPHCVVSSVCKFDIL